MPRGIVAINRIWQERQEAAQRAEEEARRAQQQAETSSAQWDDPNALPSADEPEPQAAPKPSYGLLDWIPTLWGDPPGSMRPRPASVPPASPPAPTPRRRTGGSIHCPRGGGGRPDAFPVASRPDPWTAALGMLPRPPAFGALQPTLPGPRLPTVGGGPPAAIAGWLTSALARVPVHPVRWPDPSASLLPDPWSLSNDLSGDSQTSDVPRVLSDATPENLWIPGAQYAGEPHGMHWHPQQHWKRISPEARKVFDRLDWERRESFLFRPTQKRFLLALAKQ